MDRIDQEIESFIKERKNKVDYRYVLSHRVIPEMVFDETADWIMKLETNGLRYLFNIYKNASITFSKDEELKETDFSFSTFDKEGIRIYVLSLSKVDSNCHYIGICLDAIYNRLYYFLSEKDNLMFYDNGFRIVDTIEDSEACFANKIFSFLI